METEHHGGNDVERIQTITNEQKQNKNKNKNQQQ